VKGNGYHLFGDTISKPSQSDSEKNGKHQLGYLTLGPESNPGPAKYGKKC
jgi:hypothetical protein